MGGALLSRWLDHGLPADQVVAIEPHAPIFEAFASRGVARYDHLRDLLAQHGLSVRQAMRREWEISTPVLEEGLRGAARFASGKGRHGDFGDI